MGRLIDQLRVAGQLATYRYLRRGTLLDSGSGSLGALAVVGSPVPGDSSLGPGIYCPNDGSNYLNVGNPLSLQLDTCTIFAVAARNETNAAQFQGVIAKTNAAGLYFNLGAEPKTFGMYDFNVVVFRASTFTETPTGIPHLFSASYQSGVVNGTAFYVDGNPCGSGTVTTVNQASPWRIGGGVAASQGLGGPVLLAGIVNRVLTGTEQAQLYYEFLQEGWVKSRPRSGFVYFYPAKRASEYAAEGIVLDSDFKRRTDGKVRDLVGNYPGTITGIVVPGKNDEGIAFVNATGEINNGDVTQLNSVASFSYETWFETPSGNVPVSYMLIKYLNATNNIYIGPIVAPGNPAQISFSVNNGIAGAQYSAGAIRGGSRQHLVCVFNGPAVADPDRMQIFLDGELRASALSYVPPNTTANLAGIDLRHGGYAAAGLPSTRFGERFHSGALSAAQVRTAYLKNFAQKLTLRETLEDVPVSLVASVAAPGQIGQWQITEDTWACVEDTAGRRSIKHIGAGHGVVSRPNTDAFGTWYFRQRTGTVSVQEDYVMFIGSTPGRYSNAAQNGYMVYLNLGRPYLFKIIAGVTTQIAVGPVGSIVVDTEYEVCVARRPSDCRFTIWMRGGAWGNVWTQVMQVADAIVTTCSWINLGSVLRSDSFPQFDPRDPSCLLTAWQGCLSPVDGELPR